MDSLLFPGWFNSAIAGLKRRKPRPGQALFARFQICLATLSLEKISPACQDNLLQARVADSSSRNVVSFSSACTTKRSPSSRARLVRPRESTVVTQLQLQPALLRLSAMISQYFTRQDSLCKFRSTRERRTSTQLKAQQLRRRRWLQCHLPPKSLRNDRKKRPGKVAALS
jgi:hypothetical protein